MILTSLLSVTKGSKVTVEEGNVEPGILNATANLRSSSFIQDNCPMLRRFDADTDALCHCQIYSSSRVRFTWKITSDLLTAWIRSFTKDNGNHSMDVNPLIGLMTLIRSSLICWISYRIPSPFVVAGFSLSCIFGACIEHYLCFLWSVVTMDSQTSISDELASVAFPSFDFGNTACNEDSEQRCPPEFTVRTLWLSLRISVY